MKLRDYIDSHGIKMTFFSKKIGYSNTHMCNIMSGKVKPSPRLKKAIELETKGLVSDSWDFSQDSIAGNESKE
jgi:hypothetical protein